MSPSQIAALFISFHVVFQSLQRIIKIGGYLDQPFRTAGVQITRPTRLEAGHKASEPPE